MEQTSELEDAIDVDGQLLAISFPLDNAVLGEEAIMVDMALTLS